MDQNETSSLFADRYRLEPVSDNWDNGRSGYTHLVFDMQTKRRGVIKRADASSPQAVQGLQNEAKALEALKGLGVPEIYDKNVAVYGTKRFYYIVIDYVEGIRLETDYQSLSPVERATILTQFFGLLAQAHQRGIVNGDVDFKHLFWRRGKEQLVVIDWGNARIGVDPHKKTEFAYDLARSAEIIFTLVTRQGHPPATGSLALPADTALLSPLTPLPKEFYTLCRWAPRIPSEDAKAPVTASELSEAVREWFLGNVTAKYGPEKHKRGTGPWKWIVGAVIGLFLLAFVAFGSFRLAQVLYHPTETSTASIITGAVTDTVMPTFTETPSPTSTNTPTLTASSMPSETPTPSITPLPRSYGPDSQIKSFSDKLSESCPVNEFNSTGSLSTSTPALSLTSSPTLSLNYPNGFWKNEGNAEDTNWRFRIDKNQGSEETLQTDFIDCFNNSDKQIWAISLNAYVMKIRPKNEFGFFLEGTDRQRREYTLWADEETLYLKVSEVGNPITVNQQILQITPHLEGKDTLLYPYYQYSVEIFLEIDSNGQDILYLSPSPGNKPLTAADISLSNMTITYSSQTVGTVKKLGLVGRGLAMQVILWPLTFFGK